MADKEYKPSPERKLKDKAENTRSAHSLLIETYEFRSKILKAVILLGEIILTSLIFADFAIFNKSINISLNSQSYTLIIGLFSIFIFFLSLLEFVFDYDKKIAEHSQAVKVLTSFIRDIDKSMDCGVIDDKLLDEFKERYNLINLTSRTTTDKAFLEAKRQLKLKIAISKAIDDDKNIGKTIKEIEEGIREEAIALSEQNRKNLKP